MTPTTDELIRQRAFELFCARGYAATSVRQVATAAKISPGVVTYHYPKKEQLFRAAIELPYGRFVEQLRQRIEAAGVPAQDRLRAVIDLLAHPGDELRQLLRLLLRQVLDSIEPLAGLAPLFMQGHIALCGRLIRDASAEGALPEGVGIGTLPIMLGGLTLPHLILDAVGDLPGFDAFARALVADTERSLLHLLRIA